MVDMTARLEVSALLHLSDQFEHTNFDFLTRQTWTGAQLVVLGSEKHIVRFKEEYSPEIAEIPVVFISDFKEWTAQCLGAEYVVIVQPYEYWNDNYIETTVEFVVRKKDHNQLLYQIGFLIQKDQTVLFAQESMSHLKNLFSIDALFDNAVWFAPFVKLLYRVDILREYRIFPDFASEDHPLVRTNVFSVHYLAALYEQSAFSSPPADFIPGAFVVPFGLKIEKSTLFELRTQVMAKNQIWRKNPWQKTYWKYLWYARYYKDTFHDTY